MSIEQLQQWAGLMDGTSPMYVYPPDKKSVIGKCGVCGKPFKATVTEVPDEQVTGEQGHV
jgi:hypothetical protein